jgi:hypothetical protein
MGIDIFEIILISIAIGYYMSGFIFKLDYVLEHKKLTYVSLICFLGALSLNLTDIYNECNTDNSISVNIICLDENKF